MANSDLICLRDDVVDTSIQVVIERSAYAALVAMGYSAKTLEQSFELLRRAEARHASSEAKLAQAQHQYHECLNSGISPFNAETWGRTCKATLAPSGTVSFLYENRHELDSWAKESVNLMPVENRPEGWGIYHAAKASALGTQPFNPDLFGKTCAVASGEAAKGCGQSDVLWSQRATSLIDALLAQVDDASMAQAKEIAKCQGWMDDEEIKSMNDMIDNDGCCAHGLDPNCCPVGCGDRD